MDGAARGRPRDQGIDRRVLEVAQRHLAEHGYEALSLVAVADEAGTTRQALYRRWPSKADLAVAAIEALAVAGARAPSDDPYEDLVAELRAFQRGVSRPDGLSMVGTMLHRSTSAELVARYRERVVAPRRATLLAILERGRSAGLLESEADLEVGVTLLTGSWYARALATDAPPPHWPERTARLVWRALGGDPPAEGGATAG